MDKYRQAIIDLDREEPHDRPKDLELLNEAIKQCENQDKIIAKQNEYISELNLKLSIQQVEKTRQGTSKEAFKNLNHYLETISGVAYITDVCEKSMEIIKKDLEVLEKIRSRLVDEGQVWVGTDIRRFTLDLTEEEAKEWLENV